MCVSQSLADRHPESESAKLNSESDWIQCADKISLLINSFPYGGDRCGISVQILCTDKYIWIVFGKKYT